MTCMSLAATFCLWTHASLFFSLPPFQLVTSRYRLLLAAHKSAILHNLYKESVSSTDIGEEACNVSLRCTPFDHSARLPTDRTLDKFVAMARDPKTSAQLDRYTYQEIPFFLSRALTHFLFLSISFSISPSLLLSLSLLLSFSPPSPSVSLSLSLSLFLSFSLFLSPFPSFLMHHLSLLLLRYTTDYVPLAVHELDDKHIGKMSFASKEDIIKVHYHMTSFNYRPCINQLVFLVTIGLQNHNKNAEKKMYLVSE